MSVDLSQFVRLHNLRAPHIMWLLGAGASASAGVPTASNMIWEFKRAIYSSRERVSIRALSDLGDPTIRLRLQDYFSRCGGIPTENSPDEYSYYFESAYPDEADRRRYIQARVEGATPSFGHYALAALMKADRVRAVWTTNFDRLVEDGVTQVFGTTARLVTAALGEPDLAQQSLTEGRWPLLGKLHGDFQSIRLKNVQTETREQDIRMRAALIESCRRFGLAVIGYSGRDDSIMDTLIEVLNSNQAFPFGLFWFHREDTPPLPAVHNLIDRAKSNGIEASIISIETFDELMSDLLVLESTLSAEVVSFLETKRHRRITYLPVPATAGAWPILRFNAVPVLTWPTTCRLVECGIGGSSEVRQAIQDAGVEILAERRKAGVICFGADEDVRKAFESFSISEFGLYSIEPRRLHYESAELGLLYKAIGQAIVRDLPLLFVPSRRGHRILVDPARTGAVDLEGLRQLLRDVSGTVPRSGKMWTEGLRIRLEYRIDRLWLLLEPTVHIAYAPDEARDDVAVEFVRARLAGRFNQIANRLLGAWVNLIAKGGTTRTLEAFGRPDGIDAAFTLSRTTAFSKRGGT